ncbi:MAG: Ig-like domain-containing protein, partial [Clostridiales Family XIII bacterium]|nr:Ig-like domain-containing protein [Clostridiales Family XIII bacterium]
LNYGQLTLGLFTREAGPAPNEVAFSVIPEDATAVVKDADGFVYTPKDGKLLVPDGIYTYEAEKDGYYSTAGAFTVPGDSSVTVELEEVKATILKFATSRATFSLRPNMARVELTTDGNKLQYVSSNPSIFTVDADGLLTLKRAGTAVLTVTATDGSGLSDSVLVVVKI